MSCHKLSPGKRAWRLTPGAVRILLGLFLTAWLAFSCSSAKGRRQETGPGRSPEPVKLMAEVSRAEAGVSDPIEFQVTLEAEPGIEVSLPEAGSGIQGFRILDMGRDGPTLKEGRNWSREWYKIEADVAGSYILPGLEVSYRDAAGNARTAATSQIYVEIKSTLSPQGGETDIRDIKPLEIVKREIPWKWIAAGCGMLLALGSLVGVLLLRRRRKAKAKVLLPPEELARRELQGLEATGILEEERYREYVFNLSLIFRRYVERRFGVPAAEQTSEEILAGLGQAGYLDENRKTGIRTFLQASDPIKYRGMEPESQETSGLREQLLSFLEQHLEEAQRQHVQV